jgi:hypothetical protein
MFAFMCTQPRRIAEALAPIRAALTTSGPVRRWGVGYVQGDDALLIRVPRSSETAVDLFEPLADIPTDCALGQAISDDTLTGTDNTPPFRFRRWMYAQGAGAQLEQPWPTLLAAIPEYLKRNLRGKTFTELAFHLFLAALHDQGGLDDPNVALPVTRRSLASAQALIGAQLVDTQLALGVGNVVATNGRSMIAARVSTREPLYLRRLHVRGERTERDESFRGVLIVSGDLPRGPASEGFEEVPVHSSVQISRDLRVETTALEA